MTVVNCVSNFFPVFLTKVPPIKEKITVTPGFDKGFCGTFAPAVLSTAANVVARERVVVGSRDGVRRLVLHRNDLFPDLGDEAKARREVNGGRWLGENDGKGKAGVNGEEERADGRASDRR